MRKEAQTVGSNLCYRVVGNVNALLGKIGSAPRKKWKVIHSKMIPAPAQNFMSFQPNTELPNTKLAKGNPGLKCHSPWFLAQKDDFIRETFFSFKERQSQKKGQFFQRFHHSGKIGPTTHDLRK